MMAGPLYDLEGYLVMQLSGQNVRGRTNLNSAKLCQFMEDGGTQGACLAETWRGTPSGVATEETSGGYLTTHHGQRTKTCARGRNGVAIVLTPKARAAWELGGSKHAHSGDGQALTIEIPFAGGQTWSVGAG